MDHAHSPDSASGSAPTSGRHSHVQRIHTDDVVLDIGEDMGSLVIYTSPALLSKEIELRRADDAAQRTHVDVTERRFNGRTIYAAVYPPLPAGRYHIWIDDAIDAGEATIVGGEVTQLDWRA